MKTVDKNWKQLKAIGAVENKQTHKQINKQTSKQTNKNKKRTLGNEALVEMLQRTLQT